MSDEAFWLGVWSIVGVCVITLILVIGIYQYNVNNQINRADSCEKAVLIGGFSRNLSDSILLCKGKN